jgi:hypothetical protein
MAASKFPSLYLLHLLRSFLSPKGGNLGDSINRPVDNRLLSSYNTPSHRGISSPADQWHTVTFLSRTHSPEGERLVKNEA